MKQLCLSLFAFLILLSGCEKKQDIISKSPLSQAERIINPHALASAMKKAKEKTLNKTTLCKDVVKNKEEYLLCLELKTQENPTIDNLNFLAGVYAVNHMYKKAIQTYERAEKKGSKKATYYKAGIYNEVFKEHEKAKVMFETITDYKDVVSHIAGIIAIKDKGATYDFLDEQIQQGNSKAHLYKGLYYIKDNEYEKAKEEYEEALEKGNKSAYFYLGNLYDIYLFKIPQAVTAYTLATQVEDENQVKAMVNLANKYLRYLERYDDAKYWYIKAIENGNKPAWYGLKEIYEKQNNPIMVDKTYRAMYQAGYDDGLINLGIYYKEQKQYEKAETIFKEGIQKGIADSAVGLGVMYTKNFKNYKEAEKWYRKAFSMGSSSGMFNLARMYHKNLNNIEKAIKYYKRAIREGETSSMLNLGSVYEKKLNDKKNALKYYKMAYKHGESKAYYGLVRLGEIKHESK